MPRKRAAYKSIRKSKVRHFRNISTVSELKRLSKHFEKLITDKKTDEAKKAVSVLISKLDRAASKGIIKKNNASRKISRLMKKLSSPAKA